MSLPKGNNYKPLNKHACNRFEDDHVSGKEVFSSHVSIGKAESNSDDRKYWITIRQEVNNGGTTLVDVTHWVNKEVFENLANWITSAVKDDVLAENKRLKEENSILKGKLYAVEEAVRAVQYEFG